MNLSEALAVASPLIARMRPFCERVELAGSTRRQKQTDLKDLEIVAIPRWEERPAAGDLFSHAGVTGAGALQISSDCRFRASPIRAAG